GGDQAAGVVAGGGAGRDGQRERHPHGPAGLDRPGRGPRDRHPGADVGRLPVGGEEGERAVRGVEGVRGVHPEGEGAVAEVGDDHLVAHPLPWGERVDEVVAPGLALHAGGLHRPGEAAAGRGRGGHGGRGGRRGVRGGGGRGRRDDQRRGQRRREGPATGGFHRLGSAYSLSGRGGDAWTIPTPPSFSVLGEALLSRRGSG